MTVQILGRRLPATATYVAALGAAVLLLLLTVAGALWQTDRSLQLNAEVRAQVEMRSHFRLLMRGLQDAETSQRGYLLTRDEAYLEPFGVGRTEVERELAYLESQASTPEREAEAARLRELATGKIDEMALTIELTRRGRRNEALLIVASDRGKAVMDELRDVIGAAEQREHNHMLEAMRAAEAAGAQLRLVVVIAGVMLFGIGILLVTAVRNAMAELRASRDEAQAAQARQMQEMAGRESAEAKVRQMQKMEAIGQITGGVAHDFNNMLAVILSALQLAKRRMERGQDGAGQFIDSAIDGARRAASLTSRLLAFARRQPLSPSVLDVNRVLGDMSELLRRTLGETVELETVLAGGLWRVHADRHELEQAILNICINARDAMPDGGVFRLALDEDGGMVRIVVADTGCGMTNEELERIFEPFYQGQTFLNRNHGGTGLGLTLVKRLLDLMGGRISFDSSPGAGSTFSIHIPRAQPQMEKGEQP